MSVISYSLKKILGEMPFQRLKDPFTVTMSYLQCMCTICTHALSVFATDSLIVVVELCDFARMK